MRILTMLMSLPLAGCATTMAGIREKPVQDVRLSPKPVDEIERCVVLSQPGDRSPYAVTVGGVRELTISQEGAGAVMLFQMRPTANGTEVTFRRKGALVNYDDEARACYATD
jgi:hypothetical protein